MRNGRIWGLLLAVLMLVLLCGGCKETNNQEAQLLLESEGTQWYCGFGISTIELPENDEPLYIAGYNNGMEISEVRDLCQARAVWLDTGAEGVLLIGIDCVALDSGTVAKIRASLVDIPNCAGIQVYSTHTHGGVDTLGLWGPVGIDGKNSGYQQKLIKAADAAGREAVARRTGGKLYYGAVDTAGMYRDSRDPQVYDSNLYQLRFSPENGNPGMRMYFYGAHAEALRGANSRLSRDYPGLLCDGVTEATGDQAIFFPGAIGGLIMTKAFVPDADSGPGAEENLLITGEKLVEYALSIEQEIAVAPRVKLSRVEFTVALDNPVFLLYRLLGILNNRAVKAESATGYGVRTELSVLLLDGIGLCLMPGEIFPELVYGGSLQPEMDPMPLVKMAEAYGVEQLLVVGLSNDEIGYIVQPSDFMINEQMPYLERILDIKGEDHYEETNSVGPECAQEVASAFEKALRALG